MKKILLVFLGVALLFSCSNDSEVVSDTSSAASANSSLTARTPALDALYSQMIASQAYSNYRNLQSEFFTKMNYSGDPYWLNSDQRILSWISANLASTTFTNLADAQTKLTNLNAAFNVLYTQNQNLYFGAATSQTSHADVIYYLGTPMAASAPNTITGDPCDCTATFNFNMAAAQNTFSTAVVTAVANYFAGTQTGPQVNQTIQTQTNLFYVVTQLHASEFVKCVLNCK